ncbi:MAG: alanine/ornithine racemase family PLP-dependent enzyme [Candidatus Izimaplasma sp.]|nr:alanine/ornithine racemase family PLP-dependent enzyme [Candidatus Izimaplasma bacterium]
MYPRINIKIDNLISNTKKMVSLAKENNIDFIMAIIKVFAGDAYIVKKLVNTGISHIGDSRIQNLKKYKEINLPKVLVRIPMLSEIKEVIKYCDISLNSELETIIALDFEAKAQNKKHEIIIMFDLGDLREGYYYSRPFLDEIIKISKLENIIIKGIGTNLTCYGGLVPSNEVLSRLVKVKETIENKTNIKLKIISGGNSSTVTLFGKNEIPKDINNLRLGESIFFGKETSYSTAIEGFNHDNFTLDAEIIECKIKPSFPEGKTSINSFGEEVNILDKGLMKRAILAVGKQDVILDNLEPIDSNVEIIGGSSDHLILDITNTNYKLGDIISFNVNYPGLLHLMNSDYIYKNYI